MLENLTPFEWRNVGPSVILAVDILKQQAGKTGINVMHIKGLLDRFTRITMNFIKNAEGSRIELQNKVIRDLSNQDKNNQNTMKSFKITCDEAIYEQSKILEENTRKVDIALWKIEEKLERVDDTAVVLEKVQKMIDDTETSVRNDFDRNKEETDREIRRINQVELSAPSLFGQGDGTKFPTMKDFVINNLEVERAKHAELLAGLQKQIEKQKMLTIGVITYQEKDLKEKLEALTTDTSSHTKGIKTTKIELAKVKSETEKRLNTFETSTKTAMDRIEDDKIPKLVATVGTLGVQVSDFSRKTQYHCDQNTQQLSETLGTKMHELQLMVYQKT